jgi:hypothetical protein
MALLQVKLKTSTAYHPQTDGLMERTNQSLEAYLRAYVLYQQDDWVDYLPLAKFAFNNATNTSTQQSPFYTQFGSHPTFDFLPARESPVPATSELSDRLRLIHEELKAKLLHAQESQARDYNCHVLEEPTFKPGQLVWLLRRNVKTTRPSDKLDHHRLGPYPVIRAYGKVTYLLNLPPYLSRLHPVFHVSLLEPYNNPSKFSTHATPEPFEITPEQDPAVLISRVLECRKIGHRFEYLV